jgi:hypothetical protein
MRMIENGSADSTRGGQSRSVQLPGAVTALARPCYEIARFGLHVVTETLAPTIQHRAVWRRYERLLVELDAIAAVLLDDDAASSRAEQLRHRIAENLRDVAEIDTLVIDLELARERRRRLEGSARLEHYRRIHDAQIAAHRHPTPAGGV